MTTPPPPPPAADENQLIAERREKLQAIRAKGVAFPNDFKPGHHAADLHHRHGQVPNEELEPQAIRVSVAGRMMLKRMMGKASFCSLQDATGRIQLRVTIDNVGPEVYDAFKHWDLGDILGAEGTLMRTKTGELSVAVTTLRLLTKSLRPLPDKHHGMADVEQKLPPALCRPHRHAGRRRDKRFHEALARRSSASFASWHGSGSRAASWKWRRP